MVYGDDFYKGHPALTRHKYGKGTAYYICADAEDSFYLTLYQKLIAETKIAPISDNIPEGIEVASRKGQDSEYVFIQNYSAQETPVELPENADILYGAYNGSVSGYSTVIYRKPRN